MKTAVIFSFLISGILSLSAQVRLESRLNMFRAGDEIVKQQVQYKDPSRAGGNVLWDFSRMNIVKDEYVLQYDTIGDFFIGIEHQTVYRYQLSNDSLLLTGFENATTRLQNIQPELVRKFPVSYGDSSFTCFQSSGRYSDRLQVDIMGTLDSRADSYGTMILPDKDTLTNVLCVKTVKRMVEDVKPLFFHFMREDTVPRPVEIISSDSILFRLETDPLVMETVSYQWYAYGYRYPVFETIKSRNIINGKSEDYFSTAFFYPPQEHYYLDDDRENRALLEKDKEKDELRNSNPWTGLTYNFYPNPAANDLNIEVFMPKSGRVIMQLTNRSGLIVWKNNFGTWAEGIRRTSVSMEGFPAGEYVLNMWFDEYSVGEIILKK